MPRQSIVHLPRVVDKAHFNQLSLAGEGHGAAAVYGQRGGALALAAWRCKKVHTPALCPTPQSDAGGTRFRALKVQFGTRIPQGTAARAGGTARAALRTRGAAPGCPLLGPKLNTRIEAHQTRARETRDYIIR